MYRTVQIESIELMTVFISKQILNELVKLY